MTDRLFRCRFGFFAAALLSLLLFTTASAQTVTRVGEEGKLNIATWNIEWFGHQDNGPSDKDRQLQYVRAVIEQSGVDLWAVQEIASPTYFNRLLDSLGTDWDGLIRNNCLFALDQRVGYIFRRERISVTRIEQLFNQAPNNHCYEFAQRPPFRLDVRFTLPDTTVNVVFINVHMKARTTQEDYDRRLAASEILKDYIDTQRMGGLIRHPVILLGDYNDRLMSSTRSGLPSPYRNFILDTDGYYPPTRILEQQGKVSWCGDFSCTSGSMIDHIIVTSDLFPHYELDSSDHYIQLVSELPSYRSTTSDHLPVYARFEFMTVTSADPGDFMPAAFTLTGAYPNPFSDATLIEYSLPEATHTRVEAFDALGRSTGVLHDGFQSAGDQRVIFDAAQLSAGIYLIRIEANGRIQTARVVKAW